MTETAPSASEQAGEAATPTREELLARAEALVPVLRERSESCERLRRCPDETIEDLAANGLLRICQPARFGGYELGWDVLCEVGQVLGRGCGSQAWVNNILNDHAQKLGTFDLRAQEDVWARDPTTRLSASFDPVGKAHPVPGGGVIFSGLHRYSSGIDHVQWVICGGHIYRDETPPRRCFFLIPKSAGRVIDDWHVMGLGGTGSKSFEVTDAFIPEHRILDGAAGDSGTGPGTAVNRAPVFQMPRVDIAASGFTAVAVGIAEGFLDEYCAYTRTRQSRGVAVAQLTGTQIGAAAAAEIASAGRMYLGSVREAMQILACGEALSKRQRLMTKLSSAFACQTALSAVQRLFSAAGGRALFSDNAMQRQIRDLYAVAAHRSLTWDAAASAYGSYLLGLDGD